MPRGALLAARYLLLDKEIQSRPDVRHLSRRKADGDGVGQQRASLITQFSQVLI
jgi:hypothetical protein